MKKKGGKPKKFTNSHKNFSKLKFCLIHQSFFVIINKFSFFIDFNYND